MARKPTAYNLHVKETFEKYKRSHPNKKLTQETTRRIIKEAAETWKTKKTVPMKGGAIPAAVLPAILKPVADTIGKITDAINSSKERQHHKNQLTGWYNRVDSRNRRAATKKELEAAAKNFSYIKKEFVKERKLPLSDKQIWEFVFFEMGLKNPMA